MIAAGLLVAGLTGFGVWKMFLAAPATPSGVIAVSGRIEGNDSAVAAKTSGRIRERQVEAAQGSLKAAKAMLANPAIQRDRATSPRCCARRRPSAAREQS